MGVAGQECDQPAGQSAGHAGPGAGLEGRARHRPAVPAHHGGPAGGGPPQRPDHAAHAAKPGSMARTHQGWSLSVLCGYFIGYNTIQLYCLCVEKFAFWLVIYIRTFNTINNRTSATQYTELKTAQIQGILNNNSVHTHARMHAPTHPPTHTHTHTHYSSGSPVT